MYLLRKGGASDATIFSKAPGEGKKKNGKRGGTNTLRAGGRTERKIFIYRPGTCTGRLQILYHSPDQNNKHKERKSSPEGPPLHSTRGKPRPSIVSDRLRGKGKVIVLFNLFRRKGKKKEGISIISLHGKEMKPSMMGEGKESPSGRFADRGFQNVSFLRRKREEGGQGTTNPRQKETDRAPLFASITWNKGGGKGGREIN